jgi:hypothetical protein
VVIVLSASIYYVAKVVRQKEHIDISLMFKELPPE